MIIRNAEKKDKRAIEHIFDLYWSDSFRGNLSQKIDGYLTQSPEIVKQNFEFIVAEQDGEVVGVAAYRDAPEHMKEFTCTENTAEFYVAAVKEKGKGVGTKLRSERINVLKEKGYTEIIFFSGETHKDSWPFHDNSDFVRVGDTIAPNAERGHVWRLELK